MSQRKCMVSPGSKHERESPNVVSSHGIKKKKTYVQGSFTALPLYSFYIYLSPCLEEDHLRFADINLPLPMKQYEFLSIVSCKYLTPIVSGTSELIFMLDCTLILYCTRIGSGFWLDVITDCIQFLRSFPEILLKIRLHSSLPGVSKLVLFSLYSQMSSLKTRDCCLLPLNPQNLLIHPLLDIIDLFISFWISPNSFLGYQTTSLRPFGPYQQRV